LASTRSTRRRSSILSDKDAAAAALASAIGLGAPDSLEGYFSAARRCGLGEAELAAVVSKAMCVKNSARDITDEASHKNIGVSRVMEDCCADDEVTRLKELAAIASATGASCLSNYRKHKAIGARIGLSEEEIAAVSERALAVKQELLECFAVCMGEAGKGAAGASASEPPGRELIQVDLATNRKGSPPAR